ncbi:MAG: PAS domain-containing protein, partial [Myxococcota bacterium]
MGLRPRLVLGVLGLAVLGALGGVLGGLSGGYAVGLMVAIGGLALLGLEIGVLQPLASSSRRLRRRLHDPQSRALVTRGDRVLDELALLDRAIGLANDDFALLHRRTRLALEVIEVSTVGVALLDDTGTITEVNPALGELFRFRAPPVGRRPIEVVSSADIHLVCEEAMERGLAERSFATESSDLVAIARRLSSGVL